MRAIAKHTPALIASGAGITSDQSDGSLKTKSKYSFHRLSITSGGMLDAATHFLVAFLVLSLFGSFVCVEAQSCAAGSGKNASDVSGCSPCVAGYFCAANSLSPYGDSPEGIVTTVAGSAVSGFVDGFGSDASFAGPNGISFFPDGTFAYITERYNHRIRRFDVATRQVSTIAGSGNTACSSGVAIGISASFASPFDVKIAPDGSYALVSDSGNNRIMHMTIPNLQVSILAGSVSCAASFADGIGTNAAFSRTSAISISSDSSFALIVDSANHRVRYMDLNTRAVTTLAGSGIAGVVDGVGAQARFDNPIAIAIGPSNLFAFVSDYVGTVRQLIIGTGAVSSVPIPNPNAYPQYYMTFSSNGLFGFSTGRNNQIYRFFLQSGQATFVAGSGDLSYSDGVGTRASFSNPYGIAVSPDTTYALVADSTNNLLRRVSLSRPCNAGFYCPAATATQISCPIGSYCPAGVSLPIQCVATTGFFCKTSGLSAPSPCKAGFACSADSFNALGGVDFSMKASTIAGTSTPSFNDGIGTSATFRTPRGVSISSDATFALVADVGNYRIRRIDISSGRVSTLSGCGVSGSFDGSGSIASFSYPFDVAISPDNSFALVADYNRIRKVLVSTGQVSTVPNVSPYGYYQSVAISPDGTFALIGDYTKILKYDFDNATMNAISIAGLYYGIVTDGIGTSAIVYQVTGISISPDGQFALFTDSQKLIRKVVFSTGAVTTLAGAISNTNPSYLDAVGVSALFSSVTAVSIAPDGSYALAADFSNNRIRRLDLISYRVTTLSGSGDLSSFDGVGANSSFFGPRGITISPDGTFALSTDSISNRIRKLILSVPCTAGNYCPAGSTSVNGVPCTPGTYCPTGSPVPIPCTAGFFCPTVSIQNPTISCPPGTYCPTGSSNPVDCPTGSYCATAQLTTPTSKCPPGKFCLVGGTAPLSVCPPGNTCDNTTGVVASCLSGLYCSGAGAATTCPIGSLCPSTGLSMPTPCIGGQYCAVSGLTRTSGTCTIGSFCPVGSVAPSVCTVGSICPSAGMSVATPCPEGYYCNSAGMISGLQCPAGTYTWAGQSSCSPCPRGLFNSTAGASICSACPSGMYASAMLGATSCQTCDTGLVCLFAAVNATTNRLAITSATTSGSVPVLTDPFKIQLAANQDAATAVSVQIAAGFAPVVLCVIVLGIMAEKMPAVRLFLTRSGMLRWQVMDLFFGESHFKTLGNAIRIQQTPFGAALSVACLVSMVALAWLLSVTNLMYPTYNVGVSSQPPDWRPHGTYQLVVTLMGLGIESCQNGNSTSSPIKILSESGSWSIPPTTSASFDAFDGSCTFTWRCSPKCQMIEAASGQTKLRLISSGQSAASYVSYTLQVPAFTKSAVDESTLQPFVLSSSFHAPNMNAFSVGALQGATATSVNLELTPYIVTFSNGKTDMVAFEPSLTGVQFGDTVSGSNFNFRVPTGFAIDFVLTRSTLSFVYSQSNPSMTNFLVLVASMMGSLVAGFGAILGVMESFLQLKPERVNSQEVSFMVKDDEPTSKENTPDADESCVVESGTVEMTGLPPPPEPFDHQYRAADDQSVLNLKKEIEQLKSQLQSVLQRLDENGSQTQTVKAATPPATASVPQFFMPGAYTGPIPGADEKAVFHSPQAAPPVMVENVLFHMPQAVAPEKAVFHAPTSTSQADKAVFHIPAPPQAVPALVAAPVIDTSGKVDLLAFEMPPPPPETAPDEPQQVQFHAPAARAPPPGTLNRAGSSSMTSLSPSRTPPPARLTSMSGQQPPSASNPTNPSVPSARRPPPAAKSLKLFRAPSLEN